MVGFAFEVLELPRFGGGVGDLHDVPGGDGLIVNPPGVGARLDHDEAAGMLGEQLGECVRFGVDGAEGVVAAAARINAGNALEPAEVDGENGVGGRGHGKPPRKW